MGVEAVLLETMRNPWVFLPLLFLYSVGVALILPVPIEIALLPFITDPPMYSMAIVAIGSGKATGSWLVFLLGLHIEDNIRRLSAKFRIVALFVRGCTKLVARTSYLGLFALLTTPFMSDTIPIYAYSLLNHEGNLMNMRYFVMTNFLAGIDRGIILFLIFSALGINLFA